MSTPNEYLQLTTHKRLDCYYIKNCTLVEEKPRVQINHRGSKILDWSVRISKNVERKKEEGRGISCHFLDESDSINHSQKIVYRVAYYLLILSELLVLRKLATRCQRSFPLIQSQEDNLFRIPFPVSLGENEPLIIQQERLIARKYPCD